MIQVTGVRSNNTCMLAYCLFIGRAAILILTAGSNNTFAHNYTHTHLFQTLLLVRQGKVG